LFDDVAKKQTLTSLLGSKSISEVVNSGIRCDLFHKEEGETPSIWNPLTERDAKRSAKRMQQKVRTAREKQRMEEKGTVEQR
jgi:hypothetical protein